ncbi:MAG: carboxypeptidase M32 [Defluviitaleaceae bacterium]|nr:carboxypeptidase M32 [Defluviitaleaceae bacterium]
MEQVIQEFRAYAEEMRMYMQAMAIMSFDANTVAPKAGVAARGKRNAFFSKKMYAMVTGEKMKGFLDALEGKELDPITAGLYRVAKKNYDKNTKVPMQLVGEFSQLTAEANVAWEKARKEDDFEYFAPYLEKILAKSKEIVGYRVSEGQHPYNLLLDDFEEGMTMEIYDEFFAKLRATIVPLLKMITESGKKPEAEFMSAFVSKADQEKISDFTAKMIGFRMEHGLITESTHPFCSGSHKTDVRMTTRYDENDFASSFYSILHESGHAIYEQNTADEIAETPLSRGVSTGLHESQSRFYENMIGRSKEFWQYITEELKTYLPDDFKNVTPEQFYRAVNQAQPSLIRVEADELTYSLHVMVRYEIERMLFNDEITVRQLPEVWNKKFEEYLGVTPPNNTLGVLQDIHWSWGMFGYFPTYSLGSAYAAQFFAQMQKDGLDVKGLIAKGDFAAITAWLTDKLHRHGSIYPPAKLLKDICGEQLNADYYTTYLKEKFEELYS